MTGTNSKNIYKEKYYYIYHKNISFIHQLGSAGRLKSHWRR